MVYQTIYLGIKSIVGIGIIGLGIIGIGSIGIGSIGIGILEIFSPSCKTPISKF